MKQTHLFFIYILCGLSFLTQCKKSDKQQITIHIEQIGSTETYIELKPIHYKFAPKKRFYPIKQTTDEVIFEIPIDSSPLASWTINNQSADIWLIADDQSFQADRFTFPSEISALHYPSRLSKIYDDWLAFRLLRNHIIADAYREWTDKRSMRWVNELDTLYQSSKEILQNTPFSALSDALLGQWLSARLLAIDHFKMSQSEADIMRKKVVQDALENSFFSFNTLWNQRAGIRDFSHNWAFSFGIQDSLEAVYGQSLFLYDIHRLGYDALNRKRMQIKKWITEPKAIAYAEMYWTAERLGDVQFDIGKPYYYDFKAKYEKDYPAFTAFLDAFYSNLKTVQPGELAPDFTFSDTDDNSYTLADFKGKYILLDFWASWCSPCFEEFPYMRNIHNQFSADRYVMIGIGLDEEKSTWQSTLNREKLPWLQLYGGKELRNELFIKYRGGGIPFIILIDPDGKILRYNDIRPSLNLKEVLTPLIGSEEN